jgi:parvulin-like peptidyl-prolyl isomerase
MIRNGFRNIFAANRTWRARLGMIFGGLCVLAACGVIRYCWGPSAAKAQVSADPAPSSESASNPYAGLAPAPPSHASPVPSHRPIPDIVAAINGHSITRDDLAQECRIHYGTEVLESMVNKFLILSECRQQGITISRRDIDEEIEQMAKSFGLPVDRWMQLLADERGIKPEQYANDIIWPSLALRRLAGARLQVTEKELTEAFEMEYGPAVKVRLIACTTAKKAQEIQALAAANPAEFGNLAKEKSEDAPSASMKGLVPPIRRFSPCPEIEQAAFGLADGQVSPVIQSAGQYVIIKRESLIEARSFKLAQVRPRLEKIISDRKLRQVSKDIFGELQKKSHVQNVLNNPQLRQQVGAGVVALVNASPIYLRQLDEECLQRHGSDVLQGLIGQRMLELACQQNRVTVSQAEIDAELARDAAQVAKPLPNGQPDVQGFLKAACKQQGVSPDVYFREVIWPAVALRKLALAVTKVEISDDDIKKGWVANYGPRARCLAIVLNSQKDAQKVWDMARGKENAPPLTEEKFGDLAAKYSIERSSRALRGQVPPIRMYGGQPDLEKEAFSLHPGQLSSLVQLGDKDDKWVILYCLGFTKPIEVKFEDVKKDIIEDIRDKKERIAMADYYERLKDSTTIDNFLDPAASHLPGKAVAARPEAGPAVPTAYNAPVQK